jgi:hypothetical protein
MMAIGNSEPHGGGQDEENSDERRSERKRVSPRGGQR